MIDRIRLALFNLISERATHGIRQHDGDLVVDIADEVYDIAQSGNENDLLARACFWQGIAQYYAGNGTEASESFLKADSLNALPQDEKSLVQGWITRAADYGPAEEADAYGGVKLTDSKNLDREAREARLKLQATIEKANKTKGKLSRREERHRKRLKKAEMVHVSKLAKQKRKAAAKPRIDGKDSDASAIDPERKLESETSRHGDERTAAEKEPEVPSVSSDKEETAGGSWPIH